MTDEPQPDAPLPYAAPIEEPAAGAPDHVGGPPRSVRVAGYLMLVNAAVALLSLMATLTTPLADYRATIAQAYPSYTSEQITKLAGDLRNLHIVVAVVLLLANAGLSLALRRGRNWARVATLLLTGMSLIITVSGGGAGGGLAAAVTLLGMAVDVGILAMLASRSGRTFFRRSRGLRESRTF